MRKGHIELIALDIVTRSGVVQRKSVLKYISALNGLATIEGVGYVRGRPGHRFTVTILDGQPDLFGITILKPDGQLLYAHEARTTQGGLQIVR